MAAFDGIPPGRVGDQVTVGPAVSIRRRWTRWSCGCCGGWFRPRLCGVGARVTSRLRCAGRWWWCRLARPVFVGFLGRSAGQPGWRWWLSRRDRDDDGQGGHGKDGEPVLSGPGAALVVVEADLPLPIWNVSSTAHWARAARTSVDSAPGQASRKGRRRVGRRGCAGSAVCGRRRRRRRCARTPSRRTEALGAAAAAVTLPRQTGQVRFGDVFLFLPNPRSRGG